MSILWKKSLSKPNRQGRNVLEKNKSLAKSRPSAGFSLIEVLVALLVLAIGFLAMATLQSFSLSRGNDALTHQMAVVQTYSILDVMRADLANAKAGAYNSTVTASACDTGGTNDAAGAMADWCAQLAQSLGVDPATKGVISCTNIGLCTVAISYNDKRAGTANGATQTVSTTTFL